MLGLATLLWAGLKVVRHAQNTFNEQWGVSYLQRPGVVRQSIRGLAMLTVIGVAVMGATAVTSLAAFGDLPGLTRVTGALIAIGLNVLLLARRSSCLSRPPRPEDATPGASRACRALGAPVRRAARSVER